MQRLLIRNGTVMTLAETGAQFGATHRADVLIEDGRILEVAPGLEAADAEIIDATDCLVMPGLIDAHRHVWQTAARGVCHDDTLKGYMREMRFLRAKAYRPEDIRIGNWVGMLEAINAGITTVFDFSHCINTPAHADAGVEGLRQAGARAVFGYGFNDVPLETKGFADVDARTKDMRRVREALLSDDDARVTMATASSDMPICGIGQLAEEINASRALGLRITIHTNTWEYPERPPEVAVLNEHGLLGEDLVFIHANLSTDDEIRMIADTGGWIVSTPETEMQMSMGPSVVGRFMRAGGRPTFGCDIISNNSGDLLVQARLGLQTQRMLDNAEVLKSRHAADNVEMTTRDMLKAVTVNGADALGLGARTGRLVPGLTADIIVLRTDDINTMPIHDAVATVLLHSHPGNVDTVIVAGKILKRDGRLLADMAQVRRELMMSHEYVNDAIAKSGMTLPDGYQAD
jgi:cytosine/adenosine deaminase-related metal-dependent hydrolase